MEDNQWNVLLITATGWVVLYLISRHNLYKSEVSRLIDGFRERVIATEDMALQFWLKGDSDVHSFQMNLYIQRLARIAMEITQLRCEKYTYPSDTIKKLRQAVTLDADASPVQTISPQDKRSKSIMSCSIELQEYFKKP